MADSRPTYHGTLNGIPFNELAGSQQLTLGRGESRGVRVFHVPWDDRVSFLNAMLGTFAWVNGLLVQSVGAQRFPGYDILQAKTVDIVGGGPATFENNAAEFNHAKITVNYGLESSEDNQTEEEKVLATETINFVAEALLMPEAGFKWTQYYYEYVAPTKRNDGSYTAPTWDRKQGLADAGKPILQQIPKLMPTIQHSFTKLDLKVLPKAILSSVIGRVNNTDFPNTNPPTDGATPGGMLLFTGAQARRTITTKETKPYELTITMTERESPWNSIWNATAGKWAVVTPPVYQGADFTPLMKYANMDNLIKEDDA